MGSSVGIKEAIQGLATEWGVQVEDRGDEVVCIVPDGDVVKVKLTEEGLVEGLLLLKSSLVKSSGGEAPGEHIMGWMEPNELRWLYEEAKKVGSVVEIGSWCGRSTYALLSGCSGKVYAVDTWLGSPECQGWIEAGVRPYDEFMKNCGGFENLEVLKMGSRDAVGFVEGEVDMVFIDGDHSYEAVREDIDLWEPKCKKVLCGHDMLTHEGVKRAVEERFGGSGYEVVEGTSIWVVRK